MNYFSWPAFPVLDPSYTVFGYNLTVSRNSSGAPNPFGPWVTLATNRVSNLNYLDASGAYNDLYRVTPVITVNNTQYTFDTAQSRPFFAWQPLYDSQVSSLLDAFRMQYVRDLGIPLTDSTNPPQSTGTNAMPFLTDSTTTRFFLSFLQNDDPVKVDANSVIVYSGTDQAHATPLVQYTDFYVNESGGYIDFHTAPATGGYLQVQYNKVRYTNDELRNLLLNCISNLSLYGINGYGTAQSNNLTYLPTSLPDRDLAEILMMIGHKKLIDQQMSYDLEAAESWKDGKVEWSADPGRALQAASARLSDYEPEITARCRNYIYASRTYVARGEYESYFDISGVLPVYSIITAGVNLAGAIGWWI